MNNKILVWSLICIIGLTSCHKQRLAKSKNNTSNDSLVIIHPIDSVRVDTTIIRISTGEPLKIQEVTFDYLTAKSKFSFKSATQDFDNTNVNIRIKKDSLIWISVTGVGFEVARGLISRDSIVFMDKFHKDYFVFSYEQLSRRYNFDLNFSLLQAIIVGNLPFPNRAADSVHRESDFLVLKQNEGRLKVDNYIGKNLKLTRLNALEVPTNNTFDLNYDDFKPISEFLFPFESMINLDVRSPKDQKVYKTNMRIKHSKIELPAQSPGFPFSVPSGYTRKR